MNLRDHDDDCVHGFQFGHEWETVAGLLKSCPGGAAVNPDYDKAEEALRKFAAPSMVKRNLGLTSGEVARLVVDAADR